MDLFGGAVWGGRLASLNPLALIAHASWVVQLVMLLLAGFSILSWAAIVFKWRELRGANEDDEAFLEVFHEGTYEQAYRAAHPLDRLRGGPPARGPPRAARHEGQLDAVHRSVRHRDRHHRRVREHRAGGQREPRGGRAGHRGGADRDGDRALRRDPRHDLLQHLRRAAARDPGLHRAVRARARGRPAARDGSRGAGGPGRRGVAWPGAPPASTARSPRST